MEGSARTLTATAAIALSVMACSTVPDQAADVEAARAVSQSTVAESSASTEVTTTTVIDPTEELAEAEELAMATGCVTRNTTRSILKMLGDEPGFERMGVYKSETVQGTEVLDIIPATVGYAVQGDWLPYLTDGEQVAAHARLFFNNSRVAQLSQIFIGEDPVEMPLGGPPYASIGEFEVDDVVATWDGATITMADGDTAAFYLLDLVRVPEDLLVVSEGARRLAWERVDVWVEGLEPIWTSDPESTSAMETHTRTEEIIPTLCVLLATEFELADEAANEVSLLEVRMNPEVFYRELGVQQLLLATEYLGEVERYLDRPEIDWWRGAVNDTVAYGDGVTSDVEYVFLFQQSGIESLAKYYWFDSLAEPLP